MAKRKSVGQRRKSVKRVRSDEDPTDVQSQDSETIVSEAESQESLVSIPDETKIPEVNDSMVPAPHNTNEQSVSPDAISGDGKEDGHIILEQDKINSVTGTPGDEMSTTSLQDELAVAGAHNEVSLAEEIGALPTAAEEAITCVETLVTEIVCGQEMECVESGNEELQQKPVEAHAQDQNIEANENEGVTKTPNIVTNDGRSTEETLNNYTIEPEEQTTERKVDGNTSIEKEAVCMEKLVDVSIINVEEDISMVEGDLTDSQLCGELHENNEEATKQKSALDSIVNKENLGLQTGTSAMQRLIAEVSSLNQIVMNAHKDLANLRKQRTTNTWRKSR